MNMEHIPLRKLKKMRLVAKKLKKRKVKGSINQAINNKQAKIFEQRKTKEASPKVNMFKHIMEAMNKVNTRGS